MKRTLVSAPAMEPITLAEAKVHLRVDIADDDAYISGLITMARESIENEKGISLINQTWDLILTVQEWSPVGRIRIPNPPLVSVASFTYLDSAGVIQTLGPGSYRVLAGTPGEIVPAYSFYWPAWMATEENVKVRYVSGYGPDAALVPSVVKHAIKLLVGTAYENRETIITGLMVMEIPMIKRLLAGVDTGAYW